MNVNPPHGQNDNLLLFLGHTAAGREPPGQEEAGLACERVLSDYRDTFGVRVSPAVAAEARPGGVQGGRPSQWVLFVRKPEPRYVAVYAAPRWNLSDLFLTWCEYGSTHVERDRRRSAYSGDLRPRFGRPFLLSCKFSGAFFSQNTTNDFSLFR